MHRPLAEVAYRAPMVAGRSQASLGSSPPSAWRGAFLTLRFLTELALLAVVAVAGAEVGSAVGTATTVAFAVLAPLVVAGLWGLFVAPRARRRLSDPARLLVELVLFLGTAAAVAIQGHVTLGTVFGTVAGATAVLARVLAPEA
jgi:Protein of unknown function (DUF2568)